MFAAAEGKQARHHQLDFQNKFVYEYLCGLWLRSLESILYFSKVPVHDVLLPEEHNQTSQSTHTHPHLAGSSGMHLSKRLVTSELN